MSQYASLRAQFFEGDIRTKLSPDEPTDPIAEMLSGNAQWAKAVTESDPDFFPTTARAQYPHTLWIGCGDSRVPETVITGAKPGDIFVKRNIGNQARHDDESLMATLTFAVEVLGVEHVIICGHSGCGAVAASLAASRRETVPGQDPIITIEGFPADSPLNLWLAPLTIFIRSLGLSSTPHEEALPVAVRENIIAQVNSANRTLPKVNLVSLFTLLSYQLSSSYCHHNISHRRYQSPESIEKEIRRYLDLLLRSLYIITPTMHIRLYLWTTYLVLGLIYAVWAVPVPGPLGTTAIRNAPGPSFKKRVSMVYRFPLPFAKTLVPFDEHGKESLAAKAVVDMIMQQVAGELHLPMSSKAL
ncbi:carbonic anhydrase [Lentinula edodes]|uniref:carbonic anhydrase n=1 Tax=Lentinula edodes TaxID=5353 RepID=A0A1Q3EL63_LENED|nr:carbonic anhydrase [Lentinula edodes]